MADRFDSMMFYFSENLQNCLSNVSKTVKQNTQEIRLRKNLPLALTVTGETVFLDFKGQTHFINQGDLIYVTQQDLEDCFKRLCNNSVFAHGEELKQGYLKLKNGCRAGVFGTITKDGIFSEINAVNIRIAREHKGAAYSISKMFFGDGWLIAGAPGSGKTTILRDFIRRISSGINGKFYRVCVIDTRGEICGNGANDLGMATDVINIDDKALGIEIALRTMYPEVVAFDEIGTTEELMRVKESFNSGVTVITTAHCGSFEELFKRNVTKSLLESGVIKYIAFLPEIIGGEIKIYDLKDI